MSLLLHYILLIIIFGNTSINCRTYYFNINKRNNEYLIYNRINLNKSIDNYPANNYLSELRNISTTQQRIEGTRNVYPLLDPEWNYNERNITREKLPPYIHKLYENLAKNTSDDGGRINFGPTRILFNNRNNPNLIQFNLTSLNENYDLKNNISDIELYFYLKIDNDTIGKQLVLRLFSIDDHDSNDSSTINPDSHKLLNVIYILEAENGWQIFKLKNLLNNSKDNNESLHLLLTISKPNENQFRYYQDRNNGTLRTFLVVKYDNVEQYYVQRSRESIFQPGSCRRHDLYVDFKKSDYSNFIISPDGYTAYTCFGKCYKNSNILPNHSKLAILTQQAHRKTLCCVPIDYAPLVLMYYDRFDNVVIKSYKDMIVGHCGCR